MRRIIVALFALAVLPVFAEVVPSYYDEQVIDEQEVSLEQEPVQTQETETSVVAAVQPNSSVVQPASPVIQPTPSILRTQRQSDRAVSRSVSSRTASESGAPAGRSRSRALANSIANTTSRDSGKPRTVQARAGSLYIPARVGVTSPVISISRGIATRGSTTSATYVPSVFATSSATDSSLDAEQLAAQTDFCKAQYASCMDNFCSVLDDNQGRCSCSSNVKKYENAENALKDATEQLEDLARKIRYLGLTKEEVQILYSQTAAEEVMQTTTDSSALKSSLDNIQKLLIDPTTQTTTSGSIISSIDLSTLDFGNNFDFESFLSDGSESISNQRGAALFDTARSRCNDVLLDCKKKNVDTSMVISSYDLEIDKQCIAYERSLTDSNDKMKTTIKNAMTILQQARLMVAQNKNKYDLKTCVNALDTCMTDDFVCGNNYQNCLDASGKYIVNGEIVPGSEPSLQNIRDDNWKYGDACAFDAAEPTSCTPATDGMVSDMVATEPVSGDHNLLTMLKDRIGIVDADGRAVGMCSTVLNQCQNYSFNDGQFDESAVTNRVMREYLVRTLSNIKAKQDQVLSDYTELCQQDVIACFNKNGASTTRPTDIATESLRLSIVAGACNSFVKTCGSAMGILELGFPDNVSQFICSGTTKLKFTGGAWICED